MNEIEAIEKKIAFEKGEKGRTARQLSHCDEVRSPRRYRELMKQLATHNETIETLKGMLKVEA